MASVDTRNKNKPRRKGRVGRLVASLVLLGVLTAAAVYLVSTGGDLSADGFRRFFAGDNGAPGATAFSFDAGLDPVFASLDGGLAVGSAGGLQYYDRFAQLVYDETFELSVPAVCVGGNMGAVYDIGGTTLKLFNKNGITSHIITSGKIISASLSDKGWLAVCSEEDGGYKGQVSVYNQKGVSAYEWHSAKGYVVSAAVSPDSKSLAVLTLTEDGSRIVFFSLSSPDELSSCTLPGRLGLEIDYPETDGALVVGTKALTRVQSDGTYMDLYDYNGRYLSGYSLGGDGFVLLALDDYLVGDVGRLVTVGLSGGVLGTVETDKGILSVSASGAAAAVLSTDELTFYSSTLSTMTSFNDTAGSQVTLLRRDGSAFCIKAHSAAVYAPAVD